MSRLVICSQVKSTFLFSLTINICSGALHKYKMGANRKVHRVTKISSTCHICVFEATGMLYDKFIDTVHGMIAPIGLHGTIAYRNTLPSSY